MFFFFNRRYVNKIDAARGPTPDRVVVSAQSAPKKKTDDLHKAKKMRLRAETDEEFVKIVEGELMTPFGLAYKAEQRAFLLACAASFRDGKPMKRFLMGGPGTGKSFVAEGVGVLHQKMIDRDCVYIAPTGVAATQLPIGFTYHTERLHFIRSKESLQRCPLRYARAERIPTFAD